MILARVADFGAEPDEPPDEPPEEPSDESYQEPIADRESCTSQTRLAVRSRLAVGGLVLVAGVCGFLLGRITSPETPEDPQAWHPALPASSAPEAPAWESQSLTAPRGQLVTQPQPANLGTPAPEAQAAPGDTSSPTPWRMAAAAPSGSVADSARHPWNQAPPTAPNVSSYDGTGGQAVPDESQTPAAQSPRLQEAAKPPNMDYQPRWNTNRGIALPNARTEGQPDRRPVESNPYAAARVARRTTVPIQPDAQPNGQLPLGAAGSYPNGRYSAPNVPRSADPKRTPGPRPPHENGDRPNVNYPTTGYPTAYPRVNQVPGW